MLEVKGDFCHDIRRILADAGWEEDYIKLGMEGSWQWNPFSSKWLDSYSLAYTVSSLLNQLFGKGKSRERSAASPYSPAVSHVVRKYFNNQLLMPFLGLDSVDPNSIKYCCFHQEVGQEW